MANNTDKIPNYTPSPQNGNIMPPLNKADYPTRFTKETAKIIGKRGGAATREKYKFKDALIRALYTKVKDENGKMTTNLDIISKTAIEEAKKNPRFWELVRDTVGDKPVEKQAILHDFGEDAIIRIGFDETGETDDTGD